MKQIIWGIALSAPVAVLTAGWATQNIAGMQGNADARRLRREITLDMEPEGIAEAQRLAREWMSANTH